MQEIKIQYTNFYESVNFYMRELSNQNFHTTHRLLSYQKKAGYTVYSFIKFALNFLVQLKSNVQRTNDIYISAFKSRSHLEGDTTLKTILKKEPAYGETLVRMPKRKTSFRTLDQWTKRQQRTETQVNHWSGTYFGPGGTFMSYRLGFLVRAVPLRQSSQTTEQVQRWTISPEKQ